MVVSTASGLKFTDFKLSYHERRLPGVTSGYANIPVDLPNDYDAVPAGHRHTRRESCTTRGPGTSGHCRAGLTAGYNLRRDGDRLQGSIVL